MSTNTLPGPWPGRQILVLETANPFMLIASDADVEEVVVEESRSDLRFLVTTCAQDRLVEEDVDNVALDVKEGGSAKPLF
ncbi:hypothetical protein G6F37_013525 [Rhizopus arrhizus]|nr:hypothetical protein G6F38_013614 [Rhizopus arrhizus]KAG1137457.1 hypothetical protein G6F37_013525 [Rhizopus arrhizus]